MKKPDCTYADHSYPAYKKETYENLYKKYEGLIATLEYIERDGDPMGDIAGNALFEFRDLN